MVYRINHLAVWLLVLAQQLTGYLWYSPVLFGNLWRSELGKTGSAGAGALAYGFAVAGSVAMTYFMAWLYQRLNLKSAGAALIVALMVWGSLGFLVPATYDLFRGIPWTVTWIDSAKTCLDLILTALVLSTWKKRHHYPRRSVKPSRSR